MVSDSNLYISGHACQRGVDYAREELQNPRRTLTSTVRISGAALRRCPVKTASPIPKSLIFNAIDLLNDIEITAPVPEGFVLLEDICGTGVPFVTTRSVQRG